MAHDLGGRDNYRSLDGRGDVPLWQQPWWLDATAGDSWDAVCLLKSERVVAALPYVQRRWNGVTIWAQPKLTQALGPWLEPRQMKLVKQQTWEQSVLRELAQAVPPNVYYRQNWLVGRDNWLPFYWEGFGQSTRYTYRLDLSRSSEDLLRGMSEDRRKALRKADRGGVRVGETRDINTVLRLIAATFRRQGREPPFSPHLVRSINDAASRRSGCGLYLAETRDGDACAAALFVRDATTTYYLLGGSDADLRRTGAQNLLMWHAIQAEAQQRQTLDFEGSMIESIEHSFRSYGSTRIPYFAVYGSRNPWLRRAAAARDLLRA